MQVSLFSFNLPEHLVATTPLEQRDASRMLVVAPTSVIPALSGDLMQPGSIIKDDLIANLPSYLKPGDVLVLNDTKVMHARLFAKRGDAKVELLLHQQVQGTQWKAFAKPAKKLRVGDKITIIESSENTPPPSPPRKRGGDITVVEKLEDGQVLLDMHLEFAQLVTYLDAHGHVPLPPYIQKKRADEEADKTRYQTVFADEAKKRSVAAPTAGLHFTDDLLATLKKHGVEIVHVTLHVGAGTFLPVKVEDTAEHVMHSEHWEISAAAADTINQAKQQGRRVIAVGTTSMRTLEGAAINGSLKAGSGNTDIFITPGYDFQMADVMLTNFHLPKSTLFMLVSAFCGLDAMQAAYKHAIEQEYRFYSYGDACLLHRCRS